MKNLKLTESQYKRVAKHILQEGARDTALKKVKKILQPYIAEKYNTDISNSTFNNPSLAERIFRNEVLGNQDVKEIWQYAPVIANIFVQYDLYEPNMRFELTTPREGEENFRPISFPVREEGYREDKSKRRLILKNFLFNISNKDNISEELQLLSNIKNLNQVEDRTNEIQNQDIENANETVVEGKSNYEIVMINNFEEAQNYQDITNWCLTGEKNYYGDYIGKDNRTLYILLQNGYKELFRGDEGYNESVIGVVINPDGTINETNGRLNQMTKYSPIELKNFLKVVYQDVLRPRAIEDIEKDNYDEDIYDEWEEWDTIKETIHYGGYIIRNINDNSEIYYIETNAELDTRRAVEELGDSEGHYKITCGQNNQFDIYRGPYKILEMDYGNESDEYFDDISLLYDYSYGSSAFKVKKGDLINIYYDGGLITDKWFIEILEEEEWLEIDSDFYYVIRLENNKFAIINIHNSKYLFNQEFDDIEQSGNDLYITYNDVVYNYDTYQDVIYDEEGDEVEENPFSETAEKYSSTNSKYNDTYQIVRNNFERGKINIRNIETNEILFPDTDFINIKHISNDGRINVLIDENNKITFVNQNFQPYIKLGAFVNYYKNTFSNTLIGELITVEITPGKYNILNFDENKLIYPNQVFKAVSITRMRNSANTLLSFQNEDNTIIRFDDKGNYYDENGNIKPTNTNETLNRIKELIDKTK